VPQYVLDKEHRLWDSFKFLDADCSGHISTQEVPTAFRRAGVRATPDDAEKMIALLDIDHNGAVSYEARQKSAIGCVW
jgi:Ca2+-binding EF-hand superfamily protein